MNSQTSNFFLKERKAEGSTDDGLLPYDLPNDWEKQRRQLPGGDGLRDAAPPLTLVPRPKSLMSPAGKLIFSWLSHQ